MNKTKKSILQAILFCIDDAKNKFIETWSEDDRAKCVEEILKLTEAYKTIQGQKILNYFSKKY